MIKYYLFIPSLFKYWLFLNSFLIIFIIIMFVVMMFQHQWKIYKLNTA